VNQPDDLNRKVHEFTDTLRSLTPEHLTDETRALLRAVRVEINWLLDQSEPKADDALPPT
jgi:hypothetical protein